jgi:hypothetical protein
LNIEVNCKEVKNQLLIQELQPGLPKRLSAEKMDGVDYQSGKLNMRGELAWPSGLAVSLALIPEYACRDYLHVLSVT